MSSPARQHKQKMLAAQNANIDLSTALPYQRLQIELAKDRQILKALKALPDKIATKKQLITKYTDWLKEVKASGKANPSDTVFTTALLWLIDIGDIETAAPYVEFAIEQKMLLSDDFQRDIADAFFEEIAEQISKGAELESQTEERLTALLTAKTETGLHALNVMDAIRAKWFKALGEQADEREETAKALEYYETALQYNERIGVKKRIEAIKKQAENA